MYSYNNLWFKTNDYFIEFDSKIDNTNVKIILRIS